MDVRLVVKKGGATKKALRLKSEETIVGRRQDCDLRIRSSAVSRRHCLLSYHDDVLHVEDLDSVNGTYLNGARVSGRQIVKPGDLLEIGPARFIVQYTLSRSAQKQLGVGEPAAPVEEELDVLPEAEEPEANPFDFNAESEELDALPFNESDTELAAPGTDDEEPAEALAADEDSSQIPVAEELDGGSWHLPQDNDLRDLLSKMDDSKPKNRPKKS